MSELQRVLNDLETRRTLPVSVEVQKLDAAARDAARVIRELAADFERYRQHRPHCRKSTCDETTAKRCGIDCSCGLDSARAKWRLE